MEIQGAARSFLKRWSDFQGRSSRSEFWWAYLAIMLVVIAASIVIGIVSAISSTLGGILYGLFGLAYLAAMIPLFALVFRRLHDTEKSAWWVLIGFLPLVGAIVLIVFYVTPGTKGPNKFGPDPLAGDTAEVFA